MPDQLSTEALPSAFLDRLRRILPEGYWPAWQASLSEQALVAFRVNPLRARRDAVLEELRGIGLSPEPVSWYPDAFLVPAVQRPVLTSCAAFNEGRIYVQNLSSMLPPLVLDARPGEEVLDLCAAPGSKTTQLAAQMENNGRLAGVERAKARFFKLQANCRRQGATIVHTYLQDGRGVGRKTPERFDRVLVDAPCSSESRFRPGDPDSYAYWSEKKIREMARMQKRLLLSGFQCLKPGGVLVYSTCTFAPEENEAVLTDLLRRVESAAEIESLNLPVENVQQGLSEWQGQSFPEQVENAMRVLPTGSMEAFFLAKIRRCGA